MKREYSELGFWQFIPAIISTVGQIAARSQSGAFNTGHGSTGSYEAEQLIAQQRESAAFLQQALTQEKAKAEQAIVVAQQAEKTKKYFIYGGVGVAGLVLLFLILKKK